MLSVKIVSGDGALAPLTFHNEVLREWWIWLVGLGRRQFAAVRKHDYQFRWRTNGIPER